MEGPRASRWPAIVGIASALVLVVSSFLVWIDTRAGTLALPGGSVDPRATGLDLIPGIVVLVAGAIVLIGSLVLLGSRARVLSAILVGVAAVAAVAAAVLALVTTSELWSDYAAEHATTDLGVVELKDLLRRALDAGIVSVHVEIGVFVAIGGGVLALIAALASLLRKQRRPPRPDTTRGANSWSATRVGDA